MLNKVTLIGNLGKDPFFFGKKKLISDMKKHIEAMKNIIKQLNAKTSP